MAVNFIIMFTPEQTKMMNARMKKEVEEEFREFKECLEVNKCYLCYLNFDIFEIKKPCIHWLLYPTGFKKRYFPLVYKSFDCFQIQSYLRWLANSEAPLLNINDLVVERASSKMIENTIRYKNIEWSFSWSSHDRNGHTLRLRGRYPHYHFQMKKDNKLVICYSDFHIPFTEKDIWTLDIQQGNVQEIQHIFGHGGGIQEVFDRYSPEELLNLMSTTKEKDKSVFEISTLVKADPGKTISGDEISDLIKESNQTGVPFAKLARGLKNIKIRTIIMPSDSIPKIAGRKPRKKK